MPEELRARDQKLIQYLNEAFGKERELEVALEHHISMTPRASYRKRLRDHLRETKSHASRLERRIKQLGGSAEQTPIPGPDAVGKVAGMASKAIAVAQAPLHVLRGTGEQEKMLKNAKTEYFNEHEEIATYAAIETLANVVGDSETASLARAIRREEERMARFLERLIPVLTRTVAQAEIPAAERRANGTRRRRSSRTSGSRRTSASRSRSTRSASGSSRTRGRTGSSSTRSRTGRARASRARATARS